MNISDKIKLSQVPIVFFHEGNFLKIYNQSLYIVKQHVMPEIKITPKTFASIRQTVVSGGIPVSSIHKRFPLATKTEFGYQISHQSWDLTGYQAWFEQHLQLNLLMNQNSTQLLFSHQEKPLTQDQLQFLSHWKMNNSSADLNSYFIQHLKDYLGV